MHQIGLSIDRSVLLLYRSIFFIVFTLLYSLPGYAWNAVGHKLVAQIAYDNLSPAAQGMCRAFLHAPESSLEDNFIESAVWLDVIRKHIHQLDVLHYINIPFTKDKSSLPEINSRNVLWAINEAKMLLLDPKTSTEVKTFSLKLLIHVLGDMHQPLHTTTKVSRRNPKGDQGGNLYRLDKSSFGKNLHQYWDNGAGSLNAKTAKNLKIKARLLEKKWPCNTVNYYTKEEEWVQVTHHLAVNQVYSLKDHRKPNKQYQYKAREITEQQITLAGCRLANLLNVIAAEQATNKS